MTRARMTLRQAAIWAARKGVLWHVDRNGEPQFMYAAVDASDHVLSLGGYDKCKAAKDAHTAAYGEWTARTHALDTIYDEIACEGGDEFPEPSELREQA